MADDEQREEDEKLTANDLHEKVSTAFLYTLTFFFFILPIKFGTSFIPSSEPSLPDNILVTYPGYILTIFSGIMLIFAIVIFRPNRISTQNFLIILSWVLVCLTTLTFGYYQYNFLYYLYSINQILIAIFTGLLVAISLKNECRARKFIIAGICGGLLYASLNGFYQYFWGFEQTITEVNKNIEEGVQYNSAFLSRVNQTLVFSYFTISNSFAAHIILTLPLFCFIIFKKFKKENISVCRVFGTTLLIFAFMNWFTQAPISGTLITAFLGLLLCFGLDHASEKVISLIGVLFIISCIAILLLTRSRAGIICFIAGLTFAGIVCAKGKLRIACIVVMLIGVCVGTFYARKVASFQVRLGYYEALIEMAKEKPMGYGFGGFSEYYNRTKDAGIEESNSPHSFFFGYLGQGGIFAGLSVIICFMVSLLVVCRQKMDPILKYCLIAGFSAWFFHSQLDFNIMIPGTVATAAILLMLVQPRKEEPIPGRSYSALFTAIIPITVTILYFTVQHAFQESKYTTFHSLLNEVSEKPPIDRVRNDMNKLAELKPAATAHFDETANWAMQQFGELRGKDQIQGDAYLSLAEEALNKAIEINPKKSSYFTRLARITFERKNFEQTRMMLDKAFELYPYNTAALSLEKYILYEWRRREPQNPRFIRDLMYNQLKRLEITLSQMKFHDHLMLSRKQLESMYVDLDKSVAELYTEIDFIKKSGLKVETDQFTKRISEIHNSARELAGVDR